MKPDQFLGKQLQDVLTVYKTLFRKTFGVTVILSFLCLLFIVALYIAGESRNSTRQISLLGFIWYRFSSGETYNLLDLSKSVFLFVVSFFSIAISRKLFRDKKNMNVKLGSFFDEMRPNDFGFLLLALGACLVIDYLLIQLETFVMINIRNRSLSEWVNYQLYFMRIYLPMLVFSYTNRLLLTKKKAVFTLKECLLVFISCWLINEVAYEFTIFIRGHIFQLFLIPVRAESQLIVESVLALPLIAALFLGYHSAMTSSALILQHNAEPELFADEQTTASV